jgi:hypothetical protein
MPIPGHGTVAKCNRGQAGGMRVAGIKGRGPGRESLPARGLVSGGEEVRLPL